MAVLSPRRLEYPFTADQLQGLRPGDRVLLSGRVFTARDRLHKHLFEGGASPVPLKDGALYHCGPVVVRRQGGWTVRAAGPTTSARAEPYLPRLFRERGVRVVIGKGGLGAVAEEACRQYGCVYLEAVGGAAQILAERIAAVNGVSLLREFGAAEAVWDLTVKDLPAVVGIDVRGRNLRRRVVNASQRALRRLLEDEAAFVA
jgi:fumarate hydratase class I